MGSRSMCFPAGPFRRWSLTLNAYANRIRADVEPYRPVGETRLSGIRYLSRGDHGYDELIQAVEGAGRESMERGLDWLLDAMAEMLSDPNATMNQVARERWTAIVQQGRAARAEYADRYGDGPEPPFEAVACVLVS